ncbi:MAG TPA: UDP-N-acetylmuramoyl-L-alanyl-D-glutamate--2,6-diaminopimelate ligase [Gammaproteobacteria bacterium]|nr:UDP-N-acetylmuramoyl-L-alanyl-D-glutamate--2,6-diaminopimelate ligase [Gammaproteobacteria bacterium]
MMAAQCESPSPLLSELLHGLARVTSAQDVSVHSLALDSRQVRRGSVFFAVAGSHVHGIDFVADAVAAGAAAIVWEPTDAVTEDAEPLRAAAVPVVAVERLGRQLGIIAARYYGQPSRNMFVVGITGTDGKTSCSHFIAQALHTESEPCGLIGTLGYGLYGKLRAGLHTTPDALTLQEELASLRAHDARAVVMEVSSHALDQGRAAGMAIDVAVLTNLSRDHLDYHGDERAYGEAKRRLFTQPNLGAAVLNLDDDFGQRLYAELPAHLPIVAYSLNRAALTIAERPNTRWVTAQDIETSATGITLRVQGSWGEGVLKTRLLGRFNASNLLASLAVLLLRGMAFDAALQRLANVETVAGRMESFGGGADQPLVVVDYAHTPRALEQVLSALREHCRGHLWCVFGAGGERDIGKRPLMGAIAERLAGHVILTDDNPRHEDATQIVMDILAGMEDADAVYVQRNRGQAIAQALTSSSAGDIVLIAGKGHEDYQQVGDQRLHFSDREQVRALLGDDAQ